MTDLTVNNNNNMHKDFEFNYYNAITIIVMLQATARLKFEEALIGLFRCNLILLPK